MKSNTQPNTKTLRSHAVTVKNELLKDITVNKGAQFCIVLSLTIANSNRGLSYVMCAHVNKIL